MTAGTARRLLTGADLDAALVAAGWLADDKAALDDVVQALGFKAYESGVNLDGYVKRDWRGSLTYQPRPDSDPLSTEGSGEIHSPEPPTGQRVDARSTGPAPLPQGMDEPLVQPLQGRVSGVVIDVRDQPAKPVPDQALALSREARDHAADEQLDDVERLVQRVQKYRPTDTPPRPPRGPLTVRCAACRQPIPHDPGKAAAALSEHYTTQHTGGRK